jgi:uncharacterized protein (TIGR02466 family)
MGKFGKFCISELYVYDGFLDLPEEERNKAINLVQKLRKESKGRNISNMGGWQSDESMFANPETIPDEFLRIVGGAYNFADSILQDIAARSSQTKNKKAELLPINYWINVNDKGDYNISHDHPFSSISVVYYLNASSGKFNLHPTDIIHQTMPDFSTSIVIITPKSGSIIGFPSAIMHSVNPSEEDNRISFAFNFGYRLL